MITLNYGVQLVTRAEWGARDPRSVQRLAAGQVTSHWEGPHMGDFPHGSCAGKVRGIQDFHMDSQGWNDIAYNAVACPHGYVFEGRGRGVRSAANGNTAGNDGAYAVCYLGGEGDPFPEDAKRAMKAAGDWLTFAGSPRNGHRDWKATACPGDDIYQWTHAGQPVTWAPPEEDDLPTPEDVWNHPVKNALKPEGANMDPAHVLLTFAHERSSLAVELIEKLSAAVLAVPGAVWDAEVYEQINEVNVLARQMLGGAHYWSYVAVNGIPPTSEPAEPPAG